MTAGNIRFVSAAIQFLHRETGTYMTIYGLRHHEIIKEIAIQGLTDDYKANHIDGFLVEEDGDYHFVDRDEATKIAKAQGIKMIASNTLTSEDLW